jgi:hypothetical protein
MTYSEFKATYPIGSSIASPEGTFLGECVSYARQYMRSVHGFISGPIGHAAQIPYNKTFLAAYEKVFTPQVGDLIFWGDDAGTWTNEYGHVAIYDGPGMMMNQNYGSNGKVTRNAIFQPGLIGYYRLKGGDMPIERKHEEVASELATGSKPGKDYNWQFVGSNDWFGMLAFWNAQSDKPGGLRDALRKPSGSAAVLKPGLYEVK